MAEGTSWDKIEIAFFIIGFCLIVIAILYYLGYQVPDFILIIIGIGAIVVGILQIISVIYPNLENES